jgi:hypothetical protein
MSVRRSSVLVVSVLVAVAPVLAQYGGRVGDAVIYMVTAKGKPDMVTVPASTVNTATGFITEDPNDLFDEPFGPDFPGESRRKMHAEDGDVFNLIVERENIESPYQYLQGPVKVMIAQGLLRLYPPNETPVDTPVGFYAPFPDTIDFGPNRPNLPGAILFWTNFSTSFPVAKVAPPGYHSPALPPNFTNGIDYLLSIGTFVGIVPWDALSKVYPGSGWVQGIDRKLIEDDTNLGVRVQLFRLRPGRTTPYFKINANTHLWILNGSVNITPAGGPTTVIANSGCTQPCAGTVYSFVPPGFAIQISNPIAYTGPTQLPFDKQ